MKKMSEMLAFRKEANRLKLLAGLEDGIISALKKYKIVVCTPGEKNWHCLPETVPWPVGADTRLEF